MPPFLLAALALVLCCGVFALFFGVARRLDNYGIVDIVWSYSFGLVALLYAALGAGWAPRRWLVAVLVVPGAALVLGHIFAVAVVNGVCDAFFGPARATAIRGVVPPEQLPTAYSQEEARTHAAGLVGPPLGGALYGLGRAFPFVVDLISYVVSLT